MSSTLLLIGALLPVRRGHVEVGPVPAAHLAARRHGRSDTGLGAHPRRHHGRRRRLPHRPHVPRLLQRPAHRHRRHQLRRLHRRVHHGVRRRRMAFVQFDIKRVLAYSTISQLGYMVMGLGVGAWTGGVFHLFTHAYFKACLFLCAGSVSHAAHHTFDMREMGGLRKHMRTTFCLLHHRHARAHRHPALRRLLVEGRDPGRRRAGPARRRLLAHARVRPDDGVHDRRLHDPVLVDDLLRRVPRPRHAARVARRS